MNKKIINTISMAMVLTIVVISGCQKLVPLEGNGNIISENRPSMSFNHVENAGNFYVYLIPDSVFNIEIEAESNLIPHIRTTIHGNVLIIDSKENLDNNYPMNIFVHTPVINSVNLSGSGTIKVEGFSSDDFSADLSGSGLIFGDIEVIDFNAFLSGSGEIDFMIIANKAKGTISGSGIVKLSGDCNYGDYKISGSGNLETYGLPVKECYAKISGSGNIYTSVSDVLNAEISGSGNIFYIGSPVVNSNISGSGQIIGQY